METKEQYSNLCLCQYEDHSAIVKCLNTAEAANKFKQKFGIYPSYVKQICGIMKKTEFII